MERSGFAAIAATTLLLASASGFAKLPPLTPEQQAKADETKAKAAHAEKVAAYQLCKAQNSVAESYAKQQKAKGHEVKIDPTACQDPGPFVPPAAAAAPAPQAAAAPAPAPSANK
jgi:hypothetical protein